jgi:hypothetical protein
MRPGGAQVGGQRAGLQRIVAVQMRAQSLRPKAVVCAP